MSLVEEQLGGLMRKSLAGDAGAYRVLLGELGTLLHRYFARRLGRDSADVEDLVQDTLMAVHAKRATYDVGQPFTVWIHAIARYKLIDHARYRRIRVTVPLEEDEAVFASDEVEAAMARRDLDAMLDTLPAQPRTLIREVKIEGRSVAETAEKTGLSEAAVKVGVHRGLKALAARFGGAKHP